MSLAETHKKLQQGQGFASLKLVDDYLETGKLPAIHDDIGQMLEMIPPDRRKGALDLGACHGLLSVRAASLGFSPVFGVELDHASVDVFHQHISHTLGRPDVQLFAQSINVLEPTSLANLFSLTHGWPINTIIARRAFPELFSDTFGKAGLEDATFRAAGAAFSRAAVLAGITYIVIEGRKWRGYDNLKNPLYRVDNEVMVLGDAWTEVGRYKECVLLERMA